MIAERREQLFHSVVEWLPAVLWAVVIYRLSATPGSQVPTWFPAPLGHFAEYALLGACLVIPFQRRPLWQAILIATVIASLYGVSDEWHQSFVPGRMPDVADWAVDTVAALEGASFAAWVVARRARQAAASRAAAAAAAAAGPAAEAAEATEPAEPADPA
jgi:VanZ family protein